MGFVFEDMVKTRARIWSKAGERAREGEEEEDREATEERQHRAAEPRLRLTFLPVNQLWLLDEDLALMSEMFWHPRQMEVLPLQAPTNLFMSQSVRKDPQGS